MRNDKIWYTNVCKLTTVGSKKRGIFGIVRYMYSISNEKAHLELSELVTEGEASS